MANMDLYLNSSNFNTNDLVLNTAQNIHTESNFQASTLRTTSNTYFGDEITDAHRFTGSLNVSGSNHEFYGTSSFNSQTVGIDLTEIENPVDDKNFNMSNKTLQFHWPSHVDKDDGVIQFHATAGFTGHLVDIRENASNPTSEGHLLHIETDHDSYLPLHIVPVNGTTAAAFAGGLQFSQSTDYSITADDNLTISSSNGYINLKADSVQVTSSLSVGGNFNVNNGIIDTDVLSIDTTGGGILKLGDQWEEGFGTLLTIDAASGGNFLFNNGDVGINITPSEKLSLAGNMNQSGSVSIYNNFTSGWAGSGWRIDQNVSNSGSSAEFDNMRIRGTLSVYRIIDK